MNRRTFADRTGYTRSGRDLVNFSRRAGRVTYSNS